MTPRGLYDLGLDQEVYMCLRKRLSQRIAALTRKTALQVLGIKGIGPKRFEHIERVLKRHGLALRAARKDGVK